MDRGSVDAGSSTQHPDVGFDRFIRNQSQAEIYRGSNIGIKTDSCSNTGVY